MKQLICLLAATLMTQVAVSESLIKKIDGTGDRTDILAIYKNNQLIYEEYQYGYTADQKHKIWSMSKSLTSLMLAKTIQQGRMQVTDSICTHVPLSELSSADMCDMTIEDILFWKSGIAWDETYLGIDGSKSNVLSGLYGDGIKDFSKYYFSLDYSSKIKNGWNYSTGDTHILGYLLKQVYSPVEYDAMPWTLLFDPLNIPNATFERDHQGTFLGGSYIYVTHGDLNKVAQFVMDEMDQNRELPRGRMDYSLTAKTNAILTQKMIKDSVAPAIPGGHWWLNRPSNPAKQIIPWPDAPADTFAAFGVFGQMMFVIPSKDLVIIRLAGDVAGGFDKNKFLKTMIEYADGRAL